MIAHYVQRLPVSHGTIGKRLCRLFFVRGGCLLFGVELAADVFRSKLDPGVVVHSQGDFGFILGDTDHAADDPTGRDDPVVFLKTREHVMVLRLFPLLGTRDQQIVDHQKDENHGAEEHEQLAESSSFGLILGSFASLLSQ